MEPSDKHLIKLFLAVLLLAALSLLVTAPHSQAAETHRGKTAKQWYELYAEKSRKARGQYNRILFLNGRVRAFRAVVSRRGPLPRSIVKWTHLAMCESGRRWHVRSANDLHHGGVQFKERTWDSMGGEVFADTADKATPVQQVAIAQKLRRKYGKGQWECKF